MEDAVEGTVAYVAYLLAPAPARPLYHARLMGGWVTASEWAVITPDLDVYVEDICLENPDLVDVRFSPGQGRTPVSLNGQRICDVAALAEDTRADLVGGGAPHGGRRAASTRDCSSASPAGGGAPARPGPQPPGTPNTGW